MSVWHLIFDLLLVWALTVVFCDTVKGLGRLIARRRQRRTQRPQKPPQPPSGFTLLPPKPFDPYNWHADKSA